MITSPNRRAALALGASAVAALALPRAALARTIAVGDMTVTPLLDGTFALTPELMPTLDAAAFAAALEAGGAEVQDGAFMAPVNAYLVRSGGRTVLVDAGGSPGFAPTMGALDERLADLGVAAGAIEAVVMTHLHPDHTGGLLAPDGAAFPNAEIVVAEAELAHWTDPATRAALPEPMRPLVDALAAALAPYEGRIRIFTGEAEVAPGMTAVALPGHTPGHMGYRVVDGDGQLLIWGDVVHAAPIQMANPQAFVAYDSDPQTAVATRLRVLDMAAADGMRVAGMHVPPGVHRVERAGEAYRLTAEG